MEKRLILDLRKQGSLEIDSLIKFEEIAYKSIEPFHDVVKLLCEQLSIDVDWWAQPPASRNTYASSFFHSFCIITYLDQILSLDQFKWGSVIVDTKGDKNSVEAILKSHDKLHIRVYVDKSILLGLRNIWIIFGKPLKFIFKKIMQLLIAKLTKAYFQINEVDKITPIILIDTFSTEKYIEEDRWYGNLSAYIKKLNIKDVYFCPIITNLPIRRMWSHYKKLRSIEKNYLIREDYLLINDIFYSVLSDLRVKKLKIPKIFYKGIDLSNLVKEEIKFNRDKNTTYEALLTYRFFKNIKNRNFQIKIAVDWYEGQILDKVWNFAVAEFYPNTKKLGYRPYFGNSFYLSIFPLEHEVKYSVCPSVILVTGEGMVKSVKKYFSQIETKIIPAFRSENIRSVELKSHVSEKINFLIALPISPAVSSNMVVQISEIIKKNSGLIDHKFLLRPHPMTSLASLNNSIQYKNLNIYLSKNAIFYDDLKLVDVLITEASSSCLEAIALGVPVILLYPSNSIGYNPIPEDIPQFMYKIVRGSAELTYALKYYANPRNLDDKMKKLAASSVMENYFESISEEKIIQIFNCA